MPNPLPTLPLLEARVLGTLAEKERTVPDTYPLTLNALVAGCNQKTSRDPVMQASEAEVQAAVDSLKRGNLVMESSGGRVARYAHNLERVLQLPAQPVALITALMLRGPQTAGELRIACERLHRFADISAVEGFLHELAELRALVTRICAERGTPPARCVCSSGCEASPRKVLDVPVYAYPENGEFLARYADLDPDFTDAAIVWVAQSSGCRSILTVDVRDFSTFRMKGGKRFELVKWLEP